MSDNKSDILNKLQNAADDNIDLDYDLSIDDEDFDVFSTNDRSALTFEDDAENTSKLVSKAADDSDNLIGDAVAAHKKNEMELAKKAIEAEKQRERENVDQRLVYAKTKTDAELEE